MDYAPRYFGYIHPSLTTRLEKMAKIKMKVTDVTILLCKPVTILQEGQGVNWVTGEDVKWRTVYNQ